MVYPILMSDNNFFLLLATTMCVGNGAVHLDTLFEPVTVSTSSQELNFEYHEALPVNIKTVGRPGNVLRFKFPREGLLIPNSLSFFFTLMIDHTNAGGRVLYTVSDIRNVFSRAVLSYGRTTILEDVQEYGVLCRVSEMYQKNAVRTFTTEGYMSGTQCQLVSTTTEQTSLYQRGTLRGYYHNISGVNSTTAGQVPKRYKTEVNLGLFKQNKPIPLMFMNEELMLELTLASAANRFAFSNAAAYNFGDSIAGFQVGRPTLRFRVYYPTLQLKNQIFNQMSTNNYILQWQSFQYQRFPLPITQTQHRLTVNCSAKRLKYAIAVIRNDNDLLDIGQDATYIYASLDPNVYSIIDSTTGYDQSRKTMLKQYQWFYNNTAIPRTPVQVSGGEKVYTATHTGTAAFNTFAVDPYSTTSGAEAYYYLRETLGLTDDQFGPPTGDVTFLCHDSFNNSPAQPPISSKISEGLTTNGIRTAPCGFIIAGKFGDKIALPGGIVEETSLDCSTPNAKLQLQLEFNAASGVGSPFWGRNPTLDNQTPAKPIPGTGVFPSMQLDVWVCYDVLAEINHKGEVTINQ